MNFILIIAISNLENHAKWYMQKVKMRKSFPGRKKQFSIFVQIVHNTCNCMLD